MLFVRPVAFFSLVVLALSKPLDVRSVVPRQDGAPLTPDQIICGELITYARNNYTVFYASEVFQCLQSVPFNDAVATRFISYYNMTLQFQSTLAYLKNPPAGYQQPAVDVFEVLSRIQNNVTAGVYKNQYSFEADVQLLINRMHDSHVSLSAGILDAFSFVSPVGLVSVSVDGQQTPEVYIAEDLLQSRLQGYKASPIKTINDKDVIEALTEFAEVNSYGYLEPHADWNALMDSPALTISGDLSVFQSATFYPGDGLNATFKNGTLLETYWLSIYNELDDTGPLTTAGDFYNYFVLGQFPASYNESSQWWRTIQNNDTTDDDSTTVDPYGAICSKGNPSPSNWCNSSFGAYPNNPIVAQTDLGVTKGGVVSGYILPDISTGVLSIPSFYQYDENVEEFINAVQYFVNNATQQNTSRVIIDLQTNDGGDVFLAYQTFKQFFYGIDPYSASRIRSHPLANVLGGAYSKWWKELEKDLDDDSGFLYNYTASEEWVIANRIKAATGGNFSSWGDYYGQVSDRGDLFSAAQRYNLSDEVFDVAAFDGWVPTGYGIGIDQNASPQIWDPKNIVILTDGLCTSTCALFVEFMNQVGVKTIAVGGRPTTGPMQGVAGSRGARIYEATELDEDFSFVSEYIHNDTAAALLPNRSDTGMWITTASINIRDQVRANDATPLQFKYEAADCRIYYTLDNIFNMTRLWHDAAKATWDDSSLCVSGSTGFPSARNTTSTLAPPKPATRVPLLEFDSTNPVEPLGGNSTTSGGLQAGLTRDTGEITPCQRSSECPDGRKCRDTFLKCGPSLVPVKACLPSCASTDKTCPTTSRCNYNAVSEASNLNAVGSRKDVNANAAFNKPFQQGFCRPTGAGLKLRCSVK